MIRLWISRGSSASVREQLSAQLVLGILSGKLAEGERLPSVRELARRLGLHANTVSAVYADLRRRGWVDGRTGGGVYVKSAAEGGNELSGFVGRWLEEGKRRGFDPAAIEEELARQCRLTQRAVEPLVIDTDEELAHILAVELAEGLSRPVRWCGSVNFASTIADSSMLLVNAGRMGEIAPLLGKHPVTAIRLRPVQDVVAGHARPAGPALIGVVSRSPSVLGWGGTLLSALGFPAESVLLRNPAQAGWRKGLSACGMIAADVCAARELPGRFTPVVIRLVAEEFLTELRDRVTV